MELTLVRGTSGCLASKSAITSFFNSSTTNIEAPRISTSSAEPLSRILSVNQIEMMINTVQIDSIVFKRHAKVKQHALFWPAMERN